MSYFSNVHAKKLLVETGGEKSSKGLNRYGYPAPPPPPSYGYKGYNRKYNPKGGDTNANAVADGGDLFNNLLN